LRTDRLTLLLAAALLIAAEVISLSLLLKGLGDEHQDRTRRAVDSAAALAPSIAGWVRAGGNDEALNEGGPKVDPFDKVSIEDLQSPLIDEPTRALLRKGEMVVVARLPDPTLSVFGSVQTAQGLKVFRLIDSSNENSRLATDRVLIAQHALILLAALIGFSLTALVPRTAGHNEAPATHAYEEAMSRLRLRDDERFATFEREKNALTATLRDREAMARAGDLTAGIVHEVRNSIGAIAAHAKFGEQAAEERIRKGALAVADEVKAIQTVMNRFVDFIRTQEVHYAPFDLARLIARVAAREQSNHGAVVEVEGAPTQVEGDEDLLERAFENIIRNACQAAGRNGRVTVRFGADATHAFVIVDDNGPGIRDATRALRPFESERPGGLGLGLPLSLKILGLHHGTLDLSRLDGPAGTQAVCRWPKVAATATSRNGPA
jgi:signal transduction histidine kinase